MCMQCSLIRIAQPVPAGRSLLNCNASNGMLPASYASINCSRVHAEPCYANLGCGPVARYTQVVVHTLLLASNPPQHSPDLDD